MQIFGTTRIWISYETTPNNLVCSIKFINLSRYFCLVYILYLVYLLIFSAAFRINAWTRAKERRFFTHRLCSRIINDQPQGYAAFNWESILQGNAGELGDYMELAVLPDRIARYLYKYHVQSYASHDLPVPASKRQKPY